MREQIHDFIQRSSTNEKRRQNLILELQKRNLQVEHELIADVHNVFVRGKSHLWLSAHYDTIDPLHSYIDNTTGVFLAMELKTLLPEVNVMFFDKEEPPFLGKGASLTQVIDTHNIVFNLDVVGIGDAIIYDAQREIEELNRRGLVWMRTPPCDTQSLWRRGIEAITISNAEKSPRGGINCEKWRYCHSSYDTLDTISDSSIEKTEETLLVILKEKWLQKRK